MLLRVFYLAISSELVLNFNEEVSTVADVKAKISSKLSGLEVSCMRLLYNGYEIGNQEILKDLPEIQDGARFFLVKVKHSKEAINAAFDELNRKDDVQAYDNDVKRILQSILSDGNSRATTAKFIGGLLDNNSSNLADKLEAISIPKSAESKDNNTTDDSEFKMFMKSPLFRAVKANAEIAPHSLVLKIADSQRIPSDAMEQPSSSIRSSLGVKSLEKPRIRLSNEDEGNEMRPMFSINKDDFKSVLRLVGLGFSEAESIEAFVLANGDEVKAANFLYQFRTI